MSQHSVWYGEKGLPVCKRVWKVKVERKRDLKIIVLLISLIYYSFQRQKEKNYRLIIQEDWPLDHSNFLDLLTITSFA